MALQSQFKYLPMVEGNLQFPQVVCSPDGLLEPLGHSSLLTMHFPFLLYKSLVKYDCGNVFPAPSVPVCVVKIPLLIHTLAFALNRTRKSEVSCWELHETVSVATARSLLYASVI